MKKDKLVEILDFIGREMDRDTTDFSEHLIENTENNAALYFCGKLDTLRNLKCFIEGLLENEMEERVK